ncbi:UNVERIFIED_CONTAM: Exocyst complex component 2 [Gekko kuhli]
MSIIEVLLFLQIWVTEDLILNTMSHTRKPPLVTGISPNEGIAWTKVTIRGENLGTGSADLIGLTICGHNCILTAEWMSASKIVCRVGQAKNEKGDIIVTTRSGGRGTSTVSFKLLKPEKIGILDQSAVWVEEMNYYDMRTDRNKGMPPLSLRPANPLGIEIDKEQPPPSEDSTLQKELPDEFVCKRLLQIVSLPKQNLVPATMPPALLSEPKL